MKLNRDNQTCSDSELALEHVIDTFLFNIDNLDTEDRRESVESILKYNPNCTVLEFLSLFNSLVSKLK